jgi:N-acetylglutamate synthase-like GNAT family acetyltransferase
MALGTIRRLRPDDATGLSGLVRRVYGDGYPRAELYVPAAIVERVATGAWISFVAVDAEGRVLGHMALEPSAEGPVAEMGMGMVLPEHRRHGVLERLRDRLVEEARAAGLGGTFVEIATDGEAAQTLANRSGLVPCGLTVGLWPGAGGRQTFVRYIRYLRRPDRVLVARVPPRREALLARLYAELGVPLELGGTAAPAGPGELVVDPRRAWGATFLTVRAVGPGTRADLAGAHGAFQRDPGLVAAYLELPLADPGAAEAWDHAEALGFVFAGVCPYGARGGDALRLQCWKGEVPVDRAAILHPFARQLAAHILERQTG